MGPVVPVTIQKKNTPEMRFICHNKHFHTAGIRIVCVHKYSTYMAAHTAHTKFRMVTFACVHKDTLELPPNHQIAHPHTFAADNSAFSVCSLKHVYSRQAVTRITAKITHSIIRIVMLEFLACASRTEISARSVKRRMCHHNHQHIEPQSNKCKTQDSPVTFQRSFNSFSAD